MKTTIPIKDIKVGSRFRKDLGDTDGLAKTIQDVGLLQPIGVTEDNQLVYGARRLEACKKLGWSEIPVNIIAIRDIIKGEFIENSARKDFTFSERQAILEEIEGQRSNLERDNQGKRSAEIVADYTGSSPAQIYKEKKIFKVAKEAPEKFGEFIEAIDNKEMSVNRASLFIDRRLQFEKQLEEEAKAKQEEEEERKREAEHFRHGVQTACIREGCGKMITVYNSYDLKYNAVCEECNLNEEKAKWEKFQQEDKHRSEVNPLIAYYHEINGVPQAWESPSDPWKEWSKHKDERYRREREKAEAEAKERERTGIDERPYIDRFGDWHFIARDYKRQLAYNPECGMTQEEWWKRVERKRQELKEKRKEWEADEKLRNESPTWQIMRELDVVRYGCKCKPELMRQGQFCPVCRLMIKVHEYALRIFKDTAEGRGIGGDMSITR